MTLVALTLALQSAGLVRSACVGVASAADSRHCQTLTAGMASDASRWRSDLCYSAPRSFRGAEEAAWRESHGGNCLVCEGCRGALALRGPSEHAGAYSSVVALVALAIEQ